MSKIPLRQIQPVSTGAKISQTFRIREISSILNGTDMVQDAHRHNFFFVLALKLGRGTHTIDFIPYQVSNNCIFIMRPGQVHELTLNAGSEGYLMEFNLEFYHFHERGTRNIFRQATSLNHCKIADTSFEKLISILKAIHQEYSDAGESYQEMIRSQLDIFFIEFVRNRQQGKPILNVSYEQERLDEFIELIQQNVSSKKQVSEYSEMLNLSGYQLSAITKNILNKTPSEMINDYLILEAKRHLLATSQQINQIAWDLGYEDPSYFIRFFRKHTGYSPEAFRANSK